MNFKGVEEIYTAPNWSGGDFKPPADNTYLLGDATYSWKEVHVETVVYATSVTGNWSPSAASTYSLGTTTYEWQGLYLGDDTGVFMGLGQDMTVYHRSTQLGAGTALAGVLVGTPVTGIIPANSLIISNVATAGDIILATKIGGTNSTEVLRIDTSAGIVIWNEGGADVDMRWETNNLAWAFHIDGGSDSILVGDNTDNCSRDKLFNISRAARTATAATNYADLWVEPAGAVTIPSGTTAIVASAYFAEPNITETGTVTLASTVYIAGVPDEGATNHALFIADGGVTFGASGTVATGIDFTGTISGNGIDFTDVTMVPSGSGGTALIRAGVYGDPATTTFVENSSGNQGGLIRLYGATSGTSATQYDRGIFVCLVTTGTKGIYPIAGLAEVRDDATGTDKVMAGQFVCDLHTTGAKLAAPAGGISGMFGVWAKIAATDGATCSASARAAAIWLDNQLCGNNASGIGEEFAIWSTTGGNPPTAWAGFSTSSVGWSQLFYFDDTCDDVVPVSNTSLKVLLDTTQYYIQLSTTDSTVSFGKTMTMADTTAINTGVANDDYFTIGAVDNDDSLIDEVARAVGSATPHFSLGAGQEFKFYASGTASFGGILTMTDAMAINTGVVDSDYFTIGAVANTPNTITELMRVTGAVAPYINFAAVPLYINDSANANMTAGLTINMGAAENEVLALKSSDVAHGGTTITETDTFAFIKKCQNTSGGLYLTGLKDADGFNYRALYFAGYLAEDTDTTKSTSGHAIVEVFASQISSTSGADVVADGNVFAVLAPTVGTLFILDEDGDLWMNGNLTTDGGTPSAGVNVFNSSINFSSMTRSVASDNVSIINIGTYDTGISSAASSDNIFGVMNNLTSTADDAYWFMNEYMKISITTADQTSKSFCNLAIRQAITKPVASTYGIQAHLTFSATGDVAAAGECVALSGQIAGDIDTSQGLYWAVKGDLRAADTPTGRGTSAAFFGVTTVSAGHVARLSNLSGATVNDGLAIYNAGTMTYGIYLSGTMTADLCLQGGHTILDDTNSIEIADMTFGTSALAANAANRGKFYFTEVGGGPDLLYCIMLETNGSTYSAVQVAIGATS